MKKVAVILINYNTFVHTQKCIESLQKTENCLLKIIVVDNASHPEEVKNLRGLCKTQENVTLIELDDNGGFATGNNAGIRCALHLGVDYILLLNNDTVVNESTISKLIEPFDIIPELGMTSGKIYYYDNPQMLWYDGGKYDPILARTEQYHYRKEIEFPNTLPITVNYISGCCMCIKKKVLDQVGGLSEEYFMYEEDVDYCIRLQMKGYSLLYVPEALIWHKEAASSSSVPEFKQYYMIRNKFFLIKKFWKFPVNLVAYTYAILTVINRIRKKEYKIRIAKDAIIDFLKGKNGKASTNFK